MTSAASNPLDWRETGERLITDAPAWVLAVTGGGVLVVVLVLGFLTLSQVTRRKTAREQYRREVLALAKEQDQPAPAEPLRMDPKPLLGGIAVSLYGLWGFATGTLDLPWLFAVGFVSMFDVLELRLFALMYKSADPAKGWTPQLRLLQTTAWAFVTASAVANIAHAPNPLAAPFMAIMPIGAAWVIELDLRRALAGKEAEERPQQTTKPGPFRLMALLWRRLWAWGFRVAGLDVTDRADEMVRRARARDAADALNELRKALKRKKELEEAAGGADLPRGRGKVSEERKRLDELNRSLDRKIRPKAKSAMELAETHDPEQGLELFQRMAWLTNIDDVALMNYGPDDPVMETLEQLNIAANADFIRSSKRAKEAEARAAEAEQVRESAEAAVAEAQATLDDLSEQIKQAQESATAAKEEAEQTAQAEQRRLDAVREERTRLENSGTSAEQLYQRASADLQQVREELDKVREEARAAGEQVVRLRGEQSAAQDRLRELTAERDRLQKAASEAEEAAQAERAERTRLEGRLDSLQRAGVPSARSSRKQVDARVEDDDHPTPGSWGGTRDQVAEIYRTLPEDVQALRGRPLATAIVEASGHTLKHDTVRRSHISEDLLAEYLRGGQLPGPREETDAQEIR